MSSQTGLIRARILQVLLLLGSMFCGAGVDEEPGVRLYYHFVNAVRFMCTSHKAFPSLNTTSFRFLQIEHFNETKPRGEIWAIIDSNSGQAQAVNDTVLKTMGERSVNVSGSINTMGMSWLQLTLFGSEIDVNMRKYGTLSCSIQQSGAKGERWTSNDIYFYPGMRFPVVEDGFQAVNDTLVDLTCLAKIPPMGGSQDATLTITRTADNVTLATWNPDKNLQCLDDAICSQVRHFREVYFYVRVRVMKAPKKATEYRCSVHINEKEYSSERVRILPDAQCPSPASHGDQTWQHVLGVIAGFMVGLSATSAFFLTDNRAAKALLKRLT